MLHPSAPNISVTSTYPRRQRTSVNALRPTLKSHDAQSLRAYANTGFQDHSILKLMGARALSELGDGQVVME